MERSAPIRSQCQHERWPCRIVLSPHGVLGPCRGAHAARRAALWTGWPPAGIAAAKISTALDNLTDTEEALTASPAIPVAMEAHATALLAERQRAGALQPVSQK